MTLAEADTISRDSTGETVLMTLLKPLDHDSLYDEDTGEILDDDDDVREILEDNECDEDGEEHPGLVPVHAGAAAYCSHSRVCRDTIYET